MRCLLLGIAVAVTSLIPVMGRADDQQIADYIKSRLQAEQQQGNLRGFNIDMRVENGTVWFKGHVSNPAQEQMILRTGQLASQLGAVQVVDEIEVKKAPAPPATRKSKRVVYQPLKPMPAPQPTMQRQQPPEPIKSPQQATRPNPYRQVSSQQYVGGAIEGIVSAGAPLPFASASNCASCAGGSAGAPAAMPASYGSSAGISSGAPNLPGYAWPAYAASPNYGALSYPKQYSASAWPYIGPFYPYPQVPLGWRKVSLEWDDGWWMLDFHDK